MWLNVHPFNSKKLMYFTEEIGGSPSLFVLRHHAHFILLPNSQFHFEKTILFKSS